MSSTLICNKTHTNKCEGAVNWWCRPSDNKSFPKCSTPHREAVTECERVNRTYGVTSDVAPSWIDPTYCGEVW